MNIQRFGRFVLLCSCIAFSYSVAANERESFSRSSIQTMAMILSDLNFSPRPADKAVLRKIIDSDQSTKYERKVAAAILNIQSSVASTDRRLLRRVTDDRSAPTEVRKLAEILIHISQEPSGSDRQVLEELLD